MRTYIIKYHPIHDGKMEDVIFTAEIEGARSVYDAITKLTKMMGAYNMFGSVTSIEVKHH